MNTKIDGLQTPFARPSGGAAPAPASAGGAKGSSPSSAADRVQLIEEAVDIVSLAKTLAAAPTIDQAKVQAVRTALESGGYRIDAQEISRRLVQLERQLQG